MLRTRVLTALAIFPPVLLFVLWGGVPLLVLSSLVFVGVNLEFFSLSRTITPLRRQQLVLTSALMPLGYLIYGWPGFSAGLVLGAALSLIAEVIQVESATHEDLGFERLGTAALGLLYPGALGSMLVICSWERPGRVTAWLLFIVIAADTCAYFGGRAIGGMRLAPRISPNKTVAGAVTGLAGAAAMAVLGRMLFHVALGPFEAFGFGLLAGVLAIFGDLIESLVKRLYEVKDSGSLLPGHGGLLDCVDALLFASPILFFIGG